MSANSSIRRPRQHGAGIGGHRRRQNHGFAGLAGENGRGDFSKLEEIYGPGFVAHAGGKDYSLEEDNRSGQAIRAAVPDLQVMVDHLIGEDGLVAVRWRAKGTNSVAAAGMPGKGATMEVEGMTIIRFRDGRIVEEWSLTDRLAMMNQLSAK